MSIFDELWGYSGERATRVWEEQTPVPISPEGWILIATTAGFVGESDLLESLYQRGLTMPRIDADLEIIKPTSSRCSGARRPPAVANGEAGERYYREQRRSLRPATYLRLHENRWVAAESTFITPELWDPNRRSQRTSSPRV